MSAPQFFVDGPALRPGERVTLSPEDSRHALRSLRLRPGEAVALADGSGLVADATVAGEEGGLALVEVHAVRDHPAPRPALVVAVAPPKGDRLAWMVQKLTELGAARIELLRTERGVRAFDERRSDRAEARLRAIAREAAMQSRRPRIPRIVVDAKLPGAPDPGTRAILLHGEGERPFGESLAPPAPDRVLLLVGPEGGFADAEVARAVAAGAAVASLGAGTLRTETAAVAAAAIALHRFGLLG